jgi:hypothetical protein
MSEPNETRPAIQDDIRVSEQQESKSGTEAFSRRTFLGVGSAGLATAALTSLVVDAQERGNIAKGEQDHSASNPGPKTSRFWMKIQIQTFLRPQITET